MKISIITICKNEKNTVAQTIESVLSQDYPHIQYIVVDGLSTDGSWEIIQSYQPRIKHLIHEQDKNLYEAMNKGLKQTTGDIIYFLNANDFLENPKIISTIIRTFQENPEIMIVKAKTRLAPTDQNIKCYPPHNKAYTSYQEAFLYLPPHQGLFAKKEVFNIIGNFNTRYDLYADYDWFLRAWKKRFPLYFLDQYAAICTPFGISFTKRWVKLPQKIKIIWNNASPSVFLYYLYHAIKRSFKKIVRLFSYAHRSH